MLFVIFWILYTASIFSVQYMFGLDISDLEVTNYSSLYIGLADMGKNIIQTTSAVVTPKSKVSYLFMFYNAFLGASFLLLQSFCSPSRGYFSLARLTVGVLGVILLWFFLY